MTWITSFAEIIMHHYPVTRRLGVEFEKRSPYSSLASQDGKGIGPRSFRPSGSKALMRLAAFANQFTRISSRNVHKRLAEGYASQLANVRCSECQNHSTLSSKY